jgi:alkylated DNA repair dioxygenase AlkB
MGYGHMDPRYRRRSRSRSWSRSRSRTRSPSKKRKRGGQKIRAAKKEKKPRAPREPPTKEGPDGAWEVSKEVKGLKLISELATHVSWKLRLQDESRRCFAAFLPSPLNEAKCRQFFEKIRDGTEWLQPEGPMGPIPRKTAWMVKEGCTCKYRYGSVEVPPETYPPWMHDILSVYMPFCGIQDPADWPNGCNVNLYENGSHAVGWHSDDEILFQGRFRDIRILSLSLGQPRKFELRKNWPEEGEEADMRMTLGCGALCTMEGMTQKHYMHRVPRDSDNLGPRINLTWRWVVKHTGNCPLNRR